MDFISDFVSTIRGDFHLFEAGFKYKMKSLSDETIK